ncbi:MAG: DUF4164 family protein [Rickettsiales bacterium]|nr:DUF4164 family protein [Rickettsiales bacterium]
MNAEATSSQDSLEQAKARLRESLGKLENAVEARIATASASQEQTIEFNALKQKLGDAQRQSQHLHEENQSLQTQVGEMQDRQRSLENTHYSVSQQLDTLIGDVEEMLNETKRAAKG